MLFTVPQEFVPVGAGLAPAADAAGRSGTAVSLKNALRAWAEFYISQLNAATILLSINQGINVAMGSSKALVSTVPIWLDNDCETSSVFVRQTDAVTFTTDATLKTKIVIFQIDPNKLDVNNGFNCIQLVTGASNAANITSGRVWIMPRFQGDTNPVNSKLD